MIAFFIAAFLLLWLATILPLWLDGILIFVLIVFVILALVASAKEKAKSDEEKEVTKLYSGKSLQTIGKVVHGDEVNAPALQSPFCSDPLQKHTLRLVSYIAPNPASRPLTRKNYCFPLDNSKLLWYCKARIRKGYHSMYNESQKKEYIETCLRERIENKTLSLTSVNATFKFTEEYEEQYGKDVAFFSEEELLTMLKAKGSRSLTSLQNTVSFLRQYAAYVLGPNLDNGYKGITKDKLQCCVAEEKVEKALLSRKDVDSLQWKMLNAVDKAILECLFIGISGKNLEDLTYLSQEQLDTESKTLKLTSGKVFRLSERQCQLLIDAFNETENISYQGDQESVPVSGFGRLYKERCNVLSGDTPDRRFRWVLRRVVIWKDYFGLAVLTMKTIAMSGLVHELKQGMASTGLALRDYLKTPAGKSLAQRYGYTSDAHYVDIILDKVKKYFP